ncbi:hypothetical protein GUJ93_ZPchr0011g27256 [Zizania palustris]|uniref:Ubiquitin-like protease family profile domain-containing protein n=1 Tax=Zizania palustris TaxID=103762 RepID=A0A8J5WHD8_ZIZPA|nr:hypothetical protein GUJ93_ZPchr0011g27256 [Zizania palustris]
MPAAAAAVLIIATQQQNEYDCGLYVMLYMETWNGKNPPYFDTKDVDKYRMNITKRLLNDNLKKAEVETLFENIKNSKSRRGSNTK